MGRKVRGTVKYKMKNELRIQHQNGKGTSRHQDKNESGEFANYEKIYSDNSYQTHISGAEQFGKWLIENHSDVREISDIDRDLVAEYIKERAEQDLSAWTISRDITAINHVMVGSNEWTEPITKDDLREDYEIDLKRRVLDDITNSREENRWLDENWERARETYGEQIDVAESFGLRRSEIISEEKGVTEDSFYYSKEDDSLYIVTIGKGGRYRQAECLEERKDEMIERYSDYIKTVENREEMPTHQETKEIIRESEHIFDEKMDNNVTLHRFRAEYAQNLFEEKLNQFEKTEEMEEITVNGYTAPVEVFEEVSQNLGHNRVDVLKNYLR